ncbi:KLH10 protein, partial [Amia calva]|nr:KLH10 protein [Amia calva]
RVLFTGSWSNTDRREYSIPGVSPEMMKLLIQYAYTRAVPITNDNVQELLVAADQFAVLGLLQDCCNFLESQLCLENCIGIWHYAKFYFCSELQSAAHRYILRHFEHLVEASDEFLELSLDQLLNIIEKDDLNVKQEYVVFEAILCWIDHTPSERRGHISVLLPKVRMALMESQHIAKVRDNELVKQTNECKATVINALNARNDCIMNGPSDSDFLKLMTRPRLPCDIMLSIGGWSVGNPTNAMEAYDARAGRWLNVTIPEESPRAYHGAAYLNGWVYCVGGFDGMNHFNSVRKFDPVAHTWHEVAPMHSRRCYVSVVVLDGFIYAMGGFDGYVRVNTAERYEPETNQWTLIADLVEASNDFLELSLDQLLNIIEKDDLNIKQEDVVFEAILRWINHAPSERRGHISVLLPKGWVYCVGGFDGVNHFNSVRKFDPVARTWHEVAPMHSRRCYVSVVVLDGFIYAMGGFNGYVRVNTAERYEPETNQWTLIAPMHEQRSDASATTLHGKVSGLPVALCHQPALTGHGVWSSLSHERATMLQSRDEKLRSWGNCGVF